MFQKRAWRTGWCILALGLVSVGSARAGDILRSIDVAPNTVIRDASPNATAHGIGPLIVVDPKSKPISTTFDHGTQYHVGVASDDPGALMFEIDREQRAASESPKSKIELNVVRNDDDDSLILKNHQGHYLSFDFKMDEKDYETPDRWVLHVQFYQCCAPAIADPAKRPQPPLVFMVDPQSPSTNDTINFTMRARDDTYAHNIATYNNGVVLPFIDGKDTIALKRGTWYNLIFYVKPDPLSPAEAKPDGQVDLWVNKKHVLHYIGNWGYGPTVFNPPTGNYGVKLGIYRQTQNTEQKIYYRSIKWCGGDAVGCIGQRLVN